MQGNSGWDGQARPESTDWEEHSAVGDNSTGRRFKATQLVPDKTFIDGPSDPDSDGTTYIGNTKSGTGTDEALWRIRRITKSGGSVSIEFADGDDEFDNVWDDRASLEYS